MNEIPQNVIDDLRADIRKEMSKKVAGWAVAGGAGLVGLAALGAWGLLKGPIADGLGVQSPESIRALIAEETSGNDASPLSDTEVRRIAAVMASDHAAVFKGNPGEDAKVTPEIISSLATQLANAHSKELKGEDGDPGTDAKFPSGAVIAFLSSEQGALGACPF